MNKEEFMKSLKQYIWFFLSIFIVGFLFFGVKQTTYYLIEDRVKQTIVETVREMVKEEALK